MPQRSKSTIEYYQVKLKKKKKKRIGLKNHSPRQRLTKTNLVHPVGARKLDRQRGEA